MPESKAPAAPITIHVKVPAELIELIDHAVAASGYTNRAELVRSAIRAEVTR